MFRTPPKPGLNWRAALGGSLAVLFGIPVFGALLMIVAGWLHQAGLNGPLFEVLGTFGMMGFVSATLSWIRLLVAVPAWSCESNL